MSITCPVAVVSSGPSDIGYTVFLEIKIIRPNADTPSRQPVSFIAHTHTHIHTRALVIRIRYTRMFIIV